MAITFERTTFPGHTPEIWRGECKILPGGFKPKQTFPTGTVLMRATPIEVDFSDMSAAVCKTAKVVSGGTTTKPRIAKGHYLQVGDVVSKVGHYAASRTITAIDTSNADYDVLTLNSAYSGLTANDVLTEATAYGYYPAAEGAEGALLVKASGASDGEINDSSVTPWNGEGTVSAGSYVVLRNSAPKYTPNAVVGAVKEFNGKGIPTIDAAYEAVVLYPSLQFPVLDEWLNGFSLKCNPSIKLIKQ